MGPRLGSRGKGPHRSVVASLGPCFNGAATWKSRKAQVSSRFQLRIARFNGAATWKSRKDTRRKQMRRPTESFNGAATWKSRKEAFFAWGVRLHNAVLQWGRDLEVAESGFPGLAMLRVDLASMGPRLGSRGKRPICTVLPIRMIASMGPRLGSRGKA